MKRSPAGRRRPSIQISPARASRLYRLLGVLGQEGGERDAILKSLGVGLRTFYRELDLLKRCAIKVQRDSSRYTLKTSIEEARGRLPFPDPQLTFSEAIELAAAPGESSRRMAQLLDAVINPAPRPQRARKKGPA